MTETDPRGGDGAVTLVLTFSSWRHSIAALVQPKELFPEAGCYVYGAGNFGRRIAHELRRLHYTVIAFIDVRAPTLRSVDGLPCIHPDELGDVSGSAYVHGLVNHYGPSSDVAEWANTRGFASMWFPADLYALPGYTLDNYWLAPPELTLTHLDKIASFHDSLEDEESRKLLRNLITYRLSTDPRFHPDDVVCEPYTPDFLSIFEQPFTFIDGGAYDGDSLVALLAKQCPILEWIAFEPDNRNMDALRDTAHRHRSSFDRYTLIKAGLSNVNGRVGFAENAGAISRIVGERETQTNEVAWTEIEIVRLDDAVSREGKIYVKLDIEGAEIDALRGMSRLLRQRPTLAVSLYQRPADLWEIPELIDGLYDSPRYRLRQHGHHGFDTVLYVTPD